MACRIGITTSPQDRKKEWQREHPNLRNWEVLKVCNTMQDAQAEENRLARQYGCQAHPGGATGQGPWYIYKFDY